MTAAYEPTDLAQLTAELAANFQLACAIRGLGLDILCGPLPESVYVDRDMWEKIVSNLISNAFKFTHIGKISVHLRSEAKVAELTVSDTGTGIPEADLHQFFRRFHRVEGQVGRLYEESAIGLTLVQELVLRHAGTITVESTVGKGTRFTVTLPYGTAHLRAEDIKWKSEAASTPVRATSFVEEAMGSVGQPQTGDMVFPSLSDLPRAAGSTERPRIVLVDDNAEMRAYVARLLSSAYTVEAMSGWEAAIDAVRREKPALVLANVMVPRLDGLELVATMRSDPTLVDIPVILLSARAGDEAKSEVPNAGGDDYLAKPFSSHELLMRISSHIRSARLRARESREMSHLHELSTRMTATSDLPSLLSEVLEATMELQRADFGDVQLYNTVTRSLELVTYRGLDRGFLDHFWSVNTTNSSPGAQASSQSCRIVVEDILSDPAFEPHRDVAKRTGFRAVQSMPLLNRDGHSLGALSTYFRIPHRPSDRDLRLTDLYARQAADVICLRLAEEELRTSEARLQAAVDLLGLGLYSWDPKTNALEWDTAVKAMWGLPPDEPVDYNIWRAGIHPGDFPRVRDEMARCIKVEGNGIYEAEYRVIGRDGLERWVATRGQTGFKDGQAASFLGIALDVTKRKEAEERLRDTEERFRQFAENSTDALWIVDTRLKKLEYVSPAFTRIWGRSRQAVIGDISLYSDTIHPDDRYAVIAALDAVVKNGEVVVQEYRIIRPEGYVRRIRDTRFPMRDEHGAVRRVAGIAKDVTGVDRPLVYLIDAEDASPLGSLSLLQAAGYQVRGFRSAQRFVDVTPVLMPGCVVFHTRASPQGGITLLNELQATSTSMPVVIIGDYWDAELAIQVMKAGAVDVLLASCTPEEVFSAVASALADVKTRAESSRAGEDARANVATLSAREREVLEGIIRGGSSKTIARELGLSPRTIDLHRSHLLERLGVRTIPEAIVVAAAAGLVSLPRTETAFP